MWGCALGPFEASALMATSPRKEERKTLKSKVYITADIPQLFSGNDVHWRRSFMVVEHQPVGEQGSRFLQVTAGGTCACG